MQTRTSVRRSILYVFFFFQAEDGIRDLTVTGVQTCALPISNSAVCYCLGITAVDPVRMGFLFERFLSKERAEPPDIDLDIEHERREEVIQQDRKSVV